MNWLLIVVPLALVVVAVAFVFAVRSAAYSAQPPADGIAAGRLRPCPETPNCASTLTDPDDASHYVAALRTDAPAERVMAAVDAVMAAEPRTDALRTDGSYRHYLARSRVFAFPDDIELWFDAPSDTLHMRGAARMGQGDGGVNKRRLERIRDAVAARLQVEVPAEVPAETAAP